MRDGKETLWDLYFGIGFLSILIAAIGACLVETKVAFALGAVYGGIVAGIVATHMYDSIEKALYMTEDGAEKYMKRMAVIRMWIMLVAIAFSMCVSKYLYWPGTVLGVLTLKVSAYLQPVIHRRITHKFYEKRREKW